MGEAANDLGVQQAASEEEDRKQKYHAEIEKLTHEHVEREGLPHSPQGMASAIKRIIQGPNKAFMDLGMD